MRVVESVSVTVPLDPWLTLKASSGFSSISVRQLRDRLDEIPHIRIGEAGGRRGKNGRPVRGGKVLIKVSDLTRWLESFRAQQARPQDVGGILELAREEVLGRPGRRGAEVENVAARRGEAG